MSLHYVLMLTPALNGALMEEEEGEGVGLGDLL